MRLRLIRPLTAGRKVLRVDARTDNLCSSNFIFLWRRCSRTGCGDDVYAILRCSEVDQGELEELLSFFYGSGHHPSANEITHNPKGAGVALRALYNNDGRLHKVFVGPDALPDDVEQLRSKIEAELLFDAKPRVRRQVLFSAARATGHFKYKDNFRYSRLLQQHLDQTSLSVSIPLFSICSSDKSELSNHKFAASENCART